MKKTGKGIHIPSKHANTPKPMRATSAVSKELASLRSQRVMLMRVIAALVTRNLALDEVIHEETRGHPWPKKTSIDIPFPELNESCEIGLSVIGKGATTAVMRVTVSDARAQVADLEPVATALVEEPTEDFDRPPPFGPSELRRKGYDGPLRD